MPLTSKVVWQAIIVPVDNRLRPSTRVGHRHLPNDKPGDEVRRPLELPTPAHTRWSSSPLSSPGHVCLPSSLSHEVEISRPSLKANIDSEDTGTAPIGVGRGCRPAHEAVDLEELKHVYEANQERAHNGARDWRGIQKHTWSYISDDQWAHTKGGLRSDSLVCIALSQFVGI